MTGRHPAIGDRLPSLDVPRVPIGQSPSVAGEPRVDGAREVARASPANLRLPRMGRRTRVLAFPHGAACRPCRAWIDDLVDGREFLETWGARMILVVPGSPDVVATLAHEPGAAHPRVTFTADPDRSCRERFGLGVEGVGLFVADRYGEIWYADRRPRAAELPAPGELETRVRYLATQCPECGVPDEPGYGAWAH